MPFCTECGGQVADSANARLSRAEAQGEQANARLSQVSAENRQFTRQISAVNRRIDRNDARANDRIDRAYQTAGYIIGGALLATGLGLLITQVIQAVSRAGG